MGNFRFRTLSKGQLFRRSFASVIVQIFYRRNAANQFEAAQKCGAGQKHFLAQNINGDLFGEMAVYVLQRMNNRNFIFTFRGAAGQSGLLI